MESKYGENEGRNTGRGFFDRFHASMVAIFTIVNILLFSDETKVSRQHSWHKKSTKVVMKGECGGA